MEAIDTLTQAGERTIRAVFKIFQKSYNKQLGGDACLEDCFNRCICF